jgi:hypothetical protein
MLMILIYWVGKINAEALVVARKAIGLAVNADKTKYVGMSRYQKSRMVTV